MEVRCPACAARYTADDEKLRGKTARMRCRACDTVWLVSGPPAEGGAERRAAVARRGAERERRDLFASRPPEHGSVRETLRPPPPGLGLSAVAARNENSVLFKVEDVLASSRNGRVKTPEPTHAPAPSSSPGKEDSGVIDLMALSSAPPKVSRPPVANLFGASEPPPSAFAREVASSSSYPQAAPTARAARMRLFGGIAAAVAVIAMCGIGVAVAFGGENPAPKAAAAIPAPPPPAPPPVVAPQPTPEPASTSTSTSAETKVASAPAKKKGTKGWRAGASKGAARVTNKSPAPPPAAKVKPADPCGCHGDFNCVLACTAGKK